MRALIDIDLYSIECPYIAISDIIDAFCLSYLIIRTIMNCA